MENTKTDYQIASMLPNPLRNRVVRIIQRQHRDVKGSILLLHEPNPYYADLMASFRWDDTREGSAYWCAINEKYYHSHETN